MVSFRSPRMCPPPACQHRDRDSQALGYRADLTCVRSSVPTATYCTNRVDLVSLLNRCRGIVAFLWSGSKAAVSVPALPCRLSEVMCLKPPPEPLTPSGSQAYPTTSVFVGGLAGLLAHPLSHHCGRAGSATVLWAGLSQEPPPVSVSGLGSPNMLVSSADHVCHRGQEQGCVPLLLTLQLRGQSAPADRGPPGLLSGTLSLRDPLTQFYCLALLDKMLCILLIYLVSYPPFPLGYKHQAGFSLCCSAQYSRTQHMYFYCD